MSRIHFQKRRDFLKGATCMVASGAAASFVPQLSLMGTALAGTVTGYKALVCIYLDGGNDSFNLLIPADNTTSIPVAGRTPSVRTLALHALWLVRDLARRLYQGMPDAGHPAAGGGRRPVAERAGAQRRPVRAEPGGAGAAVAVQQRSPGLRRQRRPAGVPDAAQQLQQHRAAAEPVLAQRPDQPVADRRRRHRQRPDGLGRQAGRRAAGRRPRQRPGALHLDRGLHPLPDRRVPGRPDHRAVPALDQRHQSGDLAQQLHAATQSAASAARC